MADDSATTAALVAATSAAAASPSLPGGGGRPHSDHHDAASFSATAALVAFLRMEADLAEEKARRLRAQATAMAIQFGVTDETQDAYELNPDDLPPLDEHGVPKYKGKKRGRKPKAKKRKMNPDRPKRKHTGYTFYMQETYPIIKAANPSLASKEVISIVAKQWKEELAAEDKQSWKERARTADEASVGDNPDADNDDAEDGAADGEGDDDEEDETADAGPSHPEDEEEAPYQDDDDDLAEGLKTGDAAINGEGDGIDEDSASPARRRNKRQKK